MSVDSKMTAIADAIRAKTGGTDALTLDGMASAIEGLATSSGYQFTKVGEMTVTYTNATIDVSSFDGYKSLTVSNFYLLPKNFIVFHTGGEATGNITCGTYNFKKSYNASTGKFTASRDSVKGDVGIKFDCEVYILTAQ